MQALLQTVPPTLQQATTDPCLCQRLLDTNSQASLGQSLVGSLLLSPGSWCTQVFVCALKESISPVSCKFWGLYGRFNGTLLPEDLCHTQVYCTQSPCPCRSPLLTCTSTGDMQLQFWLSLFRVSGSWYTNLQGLFEPSEHLWRVWGLILIVILPLLQSCWGFSFALGCGVSFLLGSNILLLMVVQQWVVILEFSQEKMSACPSTPPSWTKCYSLGVVCSFCRPERSFAYLFSVLH